jgi:polysaccharide deacetylase 2 family uncharacterized protein YibQ
MAETPPRPDQQQGSLLDEPSTVAPGPKRHNILRLWLISGGLGVAGVICLSLALWLHTPPATMPAADTTTTTAPAPTTPPTAGISLTLHSPAPSPTVAPRWPAVPRYVANAVPSNVPAGTPKIAILIDDMGEIESRSAAALDLPAPMTFAFLPYGNYSVNQAFQARVRGHEVMVHLPMEPHSRNLEEPINPGPNALFTSMDLATVSQTVATNLAELKHFATGVNNHMGSKFTEWPAGLNTVFRQLQAEGLFFLDSVTTANSAVSVAAMGLDLPVLKRDIFLDHYIDTPKIEEALAKLEEHARQHGHAIAIGHPHPQTVAALAAWAPSLTAKGLALVPVSALLP